MKIISLLFFLIFAGLIFTWNGEIMSFWSEQSNRSIVLKEILWWLKSMDFILEFIRANSLMILSWLIAVIVWMSIYTLMGRKGKVAIKHKNPFLSWRAIIDGNSILSKESLPESEKERETHAKTKPFLTPDTLSGKKWINKEKPSSRDDDTSLKSFLDKDTKK